MFTLTENPSQGAMLPSGPLIHFPFKSLDMFGHDMKDNICYE